MTQKEKDAWDNVLIVGREERLLWNLPSIFSRAGYTVDILTSASIMKSCRFIKHCEVIPFSACIVSKAAQKCYSYDKIIIAEDAILSEVLHSNLPVKTKLQLLPVLKEENLSHLHSKIGLSHALSTTKIQIPSYHVATTIQEARDAAVKLGYPVFLKVDASGGGFGVYECNSSTDFQTIDSTVWQTPVLVQKKIEGVTLDLSAFYSDGELIHFSYSIMEKVILNRFGPSSVRTYRSLSSVNPNIFEELREIGKALGADGFTNTTCIEAYDGSGRYYIEVDMRPNVWLAMPAYFGDDIAERILKREKLEYPIKRAEGYPSEMIIPYFLRLTFAELLTNRYNVWKFIPKGNNFLICRLLLKKIRTSLSSYSPKKMVKRLIPKKYHPQLKKLLTGSKVRR